MKLEQWDVNKRKQILQQRLKDSRSSKKRIEERWESAEQSLLPLLGSDETTGLNVSPDVVGDVSDEFPEVGTNYLMRNIRFLHSQMSSNTPICSPKPTSYDVADRDAADAADRISRWALRAYEIHDEIDLRNLQTLIYGSGFTKERWNSHAGEFLDTDEEGNYLMEGDYELSVPNVWDIFLDADARKWSQVNYLFERIRIPWQEAKHRWPQHVDQLKMHRKKGGESPATKGDMGGGKSVQAPESYDVVELWEYWEKGLPSNGYIGRFTIITEDGYEIEELRPNPETYKPIGATKAEMDRLIAEKKMPQGRAILPYDILTDIDDLDRPWGKSTLDFAGPLQDNLNRLDSSLLQTADANGTPRLLVHESSELSDDSITSTAYDIVIWAGNMPPDLMNAAPLSQVVAHLRQQFKNDIDEVMGLNESMFGQQSREQSGFSQTYSVNQGNMVRQRLFNKFVRNTERIYTRLLLMAANRWKTSRIVKVIGDENIVETRALRGADIAFGYDVRCEFSASLSLDPMTRRSEIINMWPILKEAGLDQKKLVSMLKMSELGNTFDMSKLAENKMKSYFNRIIETGIPQAPREKENHADMLAFAADYVMMEAFDKLPEPIKMMIEDHITAREDLLKAQLQPETAPGAAPEAPEELQDALPPGPPVGLL